jgi:hypothetical protein
MASTKDGLSNVDPLNACTEARQQFRYGTDGCSTINIGARDKVTLLYDQSANRCDEIAFLQGMKSRTEAQDVQLKLEVARLKKSFGAVVGLNRSPSGGDRPIFSDASNPRVNNRKAVKPLETGASTNRRPASEKPRDAANSN